MLSSVAIAVELGITAAIPVGLRRNSRRSRVSITDRHSAGRPPRAAGEIHASDESAEAIGYLGRLDSTRGDAYSWEPRSVRWLDGAPPGGLYPLFHISMR